MLFDYGDDWIFEFECLAIKKSGDFRNGTIIKISGVAPQQYGHNYETE